MKRKLFISAALLGVIITGCKKEDDTTPDPTTNTGGNNTTTPTIALVMDSTVSSDPNEDARVRKFEYNSDEKLVKITQRRGTDEWFDSLTYNSSGKLISHVSYDGSGTTTYDTHIFNYSSAGMLETITENGTDDTVSYTRVHTFTYGSNGKVSSLTQVYTVGGDSNNRTNDTLTGFTYSGNNIVSLNYNGMEITATTDLTAKNPYYGLFVNATEFIDIVNENNILKAYPTAAPTQTFVNNTYTYADGRVATIISTTQDGASPVTRTTYLTYGELE